ncbi:MAG: Uma2 family endonuclease [Sandaracinaceae bacterium]
MAHPTRSTDALSALEWAALAPDVPGELVDGRLEGEEMTDFVHDLVVAWILATVGPWVSGRDGVAAASDARLGVAADRHRKPDASFYLPETPSPPGRGLVTTPPTIAVEVISPTPRDARRHRVETLHDYAAFGVAWYWIVDPQLRTFEVLDLGTDGRYVHALAASSGAVAIPGGPELRPDLDDLWRRVEAVEVTDLD